MPSLETYEAALCLQPGAARVQVSPLVIADRLLTLAQDAERAGFPGPAERMLRLAYAVWDEKPH